MKQTNMNGDIYTFSLANELNSEYYCHLLPYGVDDLSDTLNSGKGTGEYDTHLGAGCIVPWMLPTDVKK